MICYKDKTFCSVECGNTECDRRLDASINEKTSLPICQAVLRDTEYCDGWKPVVNIK